MRNIKHVVATLVLSSLTILPSCGDPERAPEVVDSRVPPSDSGVVVGEAVVVEQPNGSTFQAIAVRVRHADGDSSYAVFLGPPALLRAVSGGTFEFRAESLPSRVRLLEQGERLRRVIEDPR